MVLRERSAGLRNRHDHPLGPCSHPYPVMNSASPSLTSTAKDFADPLGPWPWLRPFPGKGRAAPGRQRSAAPGRATRATGGPRESIAAASSRTAAIGIICAVNPAPWAGQPPGVDALCPTTSRLQEPTFPRGAHPFERGQTRPGGAARYQSPLSGSLDPAGRLRGAQRVARARRAGGTWTTRPGGMGDRTCGSTCRSHRFPKTQERPGRRLGSPPGTRARAPMSAVPNAGRLAQAPVTYRSPARTG